MTTVSRTVSVTGHGQVRVPRDAAVVRFSAVHRAPELKAALAGAESARAQAVQVATRHVDAADVASAGLEVYPIHDEAQRPTSGEARHSLTVRCPDLAVAGDLVQSLVAALGDRVRIDGVTLTAHPTPDAARIARERAFDDARARALQLAGLAGAELGDVLAVAEGGAATPASGRFLAATAEVAFEPGAEEILASLEVTWALV